VCSEHLIDAKSSVQLPEVNMKKPVVWYVDDLPSMECPYREGLGVLVGELL
jgi:hypothetical protein